MLAATVAPTEMNVAVVPSTKNHGSSGTAAPAAKSASELTAAVVGEPSSSGLIPNTVRAEKSRNRRSSSGNSVAARWAVSVARPASTSLSVSWSSTSFGLRRTSNFNSSRMPSYSST